LQQIESEAAAHVTAMLELNAAVTITGPGADHPRCGATGTDIGNVREVIVHVNGEHIPVTYYSDLASAYEHDEPCKDYAVCLANEIIRLYERTHVSTGGGVAADAVTVERDDDETEMETI